MLRFVLAAVALFTAAAAPVVPNSPYVAGEATPYTLEIYALEQGQSIDADPVKYPVPVDVMAACMGQDQMAVIAHWVAEHPKKVFVRATCRMGAEATEQPL
jgi:hypothetical protein